MENRPRNATARAASEVEVEILAPNEFFDQITGSPRVVRELIQRTQSAAARGRRAFLTNSEAVWLSASLSP